MTLPDSTASGSPPAGSAPAGRRHSRWRKVAVVLGVTLSVLLVAGGVGGFFLYRYLEGNITVFDPTDALGTDRPTKEPRNVEDENEPLNILVMGSDTRQGQGVGFGSAGVITGARSDTTMLLHLPADRESALAVSIPRDTIVDIPECKTETGVYPAHRERFNAAFSIGGPACTIKTVESLTDVFIDHFIVVDFQGFEGIVEALGGVDVCLPEPIVEPKSGLDLPAGISTVSGDQALAYVRLRAYGTGSDISRIDRQQAFMSSVVDKAKSSGTLLNPVKLVRFLDAATKSLTTDPGLGNLSELRKLAGQVRSIPSKDITFLTTPWIVNPEDPNTVVWNEPKTDKLWEALQTDSEYPPPAPEPDVIDGEPLTALPATISVRVLNGSQTDGAATQAAAELTRAGYNVIGIDTAESSDFLSSVVRYEYSTDAARTLTAAVPGSTRVKRAGLGTTVEVVVGDDWQGVERVVVKKPPATGIRTANDDICKTDS